MKISGTSLFNTCAALVAISTMFTSGCNRSTDVIPDWDAYIDGHQAWQELRLERLKSERGWLNLAGLFWLQEGENRFGSDSANNIVFPESFPAFGGKIILWDTTLQLIAHPNAEILVEGEPVTERRLQHDQQANTTTMELGSYRWFIIKRGDRYGIRLRDLEHPRIKELDHIPYYPFNKEYVVEAELMEFDTARTVEVPTVIEGFNEYYNAPGELVFRIGGKRQTLLPFKSGNGFFLIVGDATNGMETYGGGRFLYTEMIDGNKVIIDFNKATNPPCAFSPFATCPLPPLENILDVKIPAGEKAVHLE
ncbi:MAG: DUF1684 domain-containing protein [Bacteroidales bacterium]|nr:DUF1684 domain-containing protein [Bacteroidales bacterium]MDT8431009.1 DUF1684 domain-containing protein [Bacteroidales bacterium]